MRKTCKRLVAAILAATTIAAPAKAWADPDVAPSCSTYDQVESNSTGGDYVGGILIYETEGTVSRSEPAKTTTATTTTSTQVGVPGSGVTGTVTVTTSTTQPGTVTTTKEPIGYYAMNDGTVYQINCLTGEFKKVSK
jgi:hypothetical protein